MGLGRARGSLWLRGDAPSLTGDAALEEVALPLPVGSVIRVRASREAALMLATWLPASSGGMEFVVFEDGSIIFDFEGVSEAFAQFLEQNKSFFEHRRGTTLQASRGQD